MKSSIHKASKSLSIQNTHIISSLDLAELESIFFASAATSSSTFCKTVPVFTSRATTYSRLTFFLIWQSINYLAYEMSENRDKSCSQFLKAKGDISNKYLFSQLTVSTKKVFNLQLYDRQKQQVFILRSSKETFLQYKTTFYEGKPHPSSRYTPPKFFT